MYFKTEQDQSWKYFSIYQEQAKKETKRDRKTWKQTGTREKGNGTVIKTERN